MSEETPLSPVGTASSRDGKGRFALGNRVAVGNPTNRKVQRLRAALIRAVDAGDVRAVIKQLVAAAKDGDTAAAKLLFDRLLGSPDQKIVTETADPGTVRVILDGNWYGNADRLRELRDKAGAGGEGP